LLVDDSDNRLNNQHPVTAKNRGNMEASEKEVRLHHASERLFERLYEDSRLRDSLSDDQAEKLLAWGYSQLQQELERVQALPGEEALPALESQTDAVRTVLRLVNRFVAQLPEASRAQSREYVAQLVDALCEVDARTVQINDMLALEKLVDRRELLESAEIFRQLLDIVRPPGGEGGAPEEAGSRDRSEESQANRESENMALETDGKTVAGGGGRVRQPIKADEEE
jgi:hypothetical protein